jgi:hypothetical protein|tara:strand:+ start:13997 stop:14971 length:975 start_codon:yes stop_codon:yes gene_type:complete
VLLLVSSALILTSCEDEATEPEETEEEYEFTIVEGNFVDPSLINDPITGELILFYLPGIIGSNPAGCPDSDDDGEDDYPCTKYIRSAVTVLSNDSMYVIDGDRVEKEISSGTFSDPDIITDGMGTYFLYVSEGQSVRVYTYGELDNTFEEQGLASDGQGGVPSGIHFGENEFGLFVTTGGGISKGISSDGISFVGPTDSNFTEITIHDDSEERDYADPSIIPWPWNEGDCTTADTSFQYLFAYHYCDSGDCSQPTNHMVGLAGTDNGTDFYPITGFETFAGSVPDIIFHDGAVFMMFTANQSVNWKKFNACFEVNDEGYAYLYE